MDEKLKCPLCPARFDDLDDLAQHLEDKHDARFPEYKIMWMVECPNCGYIYEAEGSPMTCPRCKYKLVF